MAAVHSRSQERQLCYHAEKERRNTRDENIMWTEMDVTGERDRGEERERWRQKRRMSWSYTISEF